MGNLLPSDNRAPTAFLGYFVAVISRRVFKFFIIAIPLPVCGRITSSSARMMTTWRIKCGRVGTGLGRVIAMECACILKKLREAIAMARIPNPSGVVEQRSMAKPS